MFIVLLVIIGLVYVGYALFSIVTGILALINGANAQPDIIEESGAVMEKRRGGLTQAAKAAWTKIVIGAAMLFVGGAIAVVLLLIQLF